MQCAVRRDVPSGSELFQGNGSGGTQKRSKGEFSGYGAPTGEDAEKVVRGLNVRLRKAMRRGPVLRYLMATEHDVWWPAATSHVMMVGFPVCLCTACPALEPMLLGEAATGTCSQPDYGALTC